MELRTLGTQEEFHLVNEITCYRSGLSLTIGKVASRTVAILALEERNLIHIGKSVGDHYTTAPTILWFVPQWLIDLSAARQLVQQYCQLPCYGNDGDFLAFFSPRSASFSPQRRNRFTLPNRRSLIHIPYMAS